MVAWCTLFLFNFALPSPFQLIWIKDLKYIHKESKTLFRSIDSWIGMPLSWQNTIQTSLLHVFYMLFHNCIPFPMFMTCLVLVYGLQKILGCNVMHHTILCSIQLRYVWVAIVFSYIFLTKVGKQHMENWRKWSQANGMAKIRFYMQSVSTQAEASN